MKRQTPDPADPSGRLRKQAEEQLGRTPRAKEDEVSSAPEEKLRHELGVHRIELEMQNEELRSAQAELEAGLDRYTQLFDFAPIGYATLSQNGTVIQVNHAGAALLGRQRRQVVG